MPNRWNATLVGIVRTAFVVFPVWVKPVSLLILARLVEIFLVLCIAALACIRNAKSCCNEVFAIFTIGMYFPLITCIYTVYNTGGAD